jgi:hypothetical protein
MQMQMQKFALASCAVQADLRIAAKLPIATRAVVRQTTTVIS